MKKINTELIMAISWVVFFGIMFGFFLVINSDITGEQTIVTRVFSFVIRIWDLIDDRPELIMILIVLPLIAIIYIFNKIRTLVTSKDQRDNK